MRIDARGELAVGHTAEEILRHADGIEIDLIVIAIVASLKSDVGPGMAWPIKSCGQEYSNCLSPGLNWRGYGGQRTSTKRTIG